MKAAMMVGLMALKMAEMMVSLTVVMTVD